MATATYAIKQPGLVSIGKFFGVLGLVWGFFMGFFVVAGVSSMGPGMGSPALGFAGGLGALGLMTLLGGVFGFIGGAIVAFVYNIVLGVTGGLEMDLGVKG